MNFDEDRIKEMYKAYVEGTDGRPRHSAAAKREVSLFVAYCSGAFGDNITIQNKLYDRMMSCAVEFEENGFINGFRYAMAILQWNVNLPVALLDSIEKDAAAHQEAYEGVNLPEGVKPKERDSVVHAKDLEGKCITSKQIGELFDSTNAKVVRRIENKIFPSLDKESQKLFECVKMYNLQNKPIKIYKLNREACMIYLKHMEPKKNQYISIAGGYAKMQELVERTFPTEKTVLSA